MNGISFLDSQPLKYKNLLVKYATDIDIFDLIEQCILSEYATREMEYLNKGKYPEKRELIMKLKADLILARQEISQSK